jgi:phenylpyruvate tautomerase PptA (4-oxalocrotonate tautomerase family)
MPILQIKSLPFDQAFDVAEAIEDISVDFADECGFALEHITVTWDYFPPGHYAVAGRAATVQDESNHPLMVSLLLPDMYEEEAIEEFLQVAAISIAKYSGIEISKIFIHCQLVPAGQVFDKGEVVRW